MNGDFKPRPGTFLPLLEAQRKDSSTRTAPASPLSLLEILARQAQQSLPMFDLQTLGQMAPSRYADALKSLRDAGYIAINGEAPEQMVRLTDSGAAVVRIAQPA
jgi:hypothetical protein